MPSGTDSERLIRRVESRILQDGLIGRGDRVLVACSGGPDSVCLLWVLDSLRRRWDWTLFVGHVDHGLRPESGQEMRWVSELAERLGLPFVWRKVEIPKHSEDAARRARYAALEELAEEAGTSVTALGHHAGDQAETVLMRLARGAGLRGVAGMASGRGRFVRPLLQETRRSILACLSEQHLDSIEDPSNRDEGYLRNWVRHRVVPLLEERNPDIVGALAAFAQRQRRDLEALDGAMELLWGRYATQVDGPEGLLGVRLELLLLEDLGPGGLWWFLRRAYGLVRDALGGTGEKSGDLHLGSGHIDRILAVCRVTGEKLVFLPGGVSAVKSQGFIVVLPAQWAKSAPERRWRVPAGAGITRLDPTGWALDAGPKGIDVATNWKGARFEGGGKLQDHYVDSRVPRILRSHLPLVVSNGLVQWALGCGAVERKLYVSSGSLEQALVRLFWTGSGREGIFDLSRPGLSVTTKAIEISGGRAFGDATQSTGANPGTWSRKA